MKVMLSTPKYPNHIKTRIQAAGYRIQDITSELDIPERTMRSYLAGQTPMPSKYLKAIADIIGCSVGELEQGAGQERDRTYQKEDWGEAPSIGQLYGREEELAKLRQWIIRDGSRAIAVLGMGGIGKTSLVATCVDQVKNSFEYVFWRSLQNAPLLKSILQDCIKFFSGQPRAGLPEDEEGQIFVILECLREHHCLVVFDNCESILQAGSRAGQYREGYEGYGRLFQRIGGVGHQSCLLLTSREKPREIALLEGNTSPVRSHQLDGLSATYGRKILEDKGLSGTERIEEQLIDHYAGNPLALKLVSQFIYEVFDGDIDVFLKDGEKNFSDIQDILHQQFERLSELEREVMYWLAIEREKISFNSLQDDFVHPVAKLDVQEALRSLRRRCLIETSAAGFTLQNVLLEFVTNRLVDHAFEEFATGRLFLWRKHALMKAHSKDYLRESQVRLLLAAVAQKLQAAMGQEVLEEQCKRLLATLRETGTRHPDYAAGNILNLLIHLQCDLGTYDFSHLTVQQVYLQDISLSGVSFAYSHLSKCVFTDTFGTALTIAFSPGGEKLATGSSNGEVRVWHTQGVTPLRINRGHTNGIRSVTFSPDETVLASGSEDHTIRLWEASGGQWLRTLEGHGDRVYSLAFSPDGTMLASGSEDQTVRLWNVGSGQCFRVLEGHSSHVRAVAFSPDGAMLASGSEDQSVRLWDVSSGLCLKTLEGCGSSVSMALSPDRKVIASSNDEMIRLWDVGSGQCLKTLDGHTSWVRAVAFGPTGAMLASGSEDPNVRLWDVSSGQCLRTLQGYAHQVWTVAFSSNGRILASAGEDHIVRIWNASNGSCLSTLQGHTSRVRSVAFSPDGYTLASGSEDQTIRLWDIGSGRCLKVLRGHTDWIYSVAVSPGGQAIASGGEDHEVHLWNLRTGQQLAILRGHTNRVRSVAFSPDGHILASGSEDHTIRLWNAESGLSLGLLQGHDDRVYSVAFSSDGQVLASSSDDQTIRLWDVRTGQSLNTLRGHTDRIRSVAFNVDGTMLASGSSDQSVRLWNLHTGQSLHVLRGHSDHVRAVTFSSDSQILASGSHDGTIKLWDAQRGEHLQTLRGDRPYERMNITGVEGLTEAQKAALIALGAVEENETSPRAGATISSPL